MKRLRCPLLLLLSLALFLAGGLPYRDSLRVSRHPGCSLWLPPEHEGRAAPAVILCGRERGLAEELCRRGYAVAAVRRPDSLDAAYSLLSSHKQIDGRFPALIATDKRAGAAALSYALSADHPISGLILWHSSAVDREELCNVLSIGKEESELKGYFAEGSARQAVSYKNRRQAAERTISWIGSTLGHPRDGVYADDDLIFPYRNCCGIAGFVAAFTALLLIIPRKKRLKNI